LQESTRNGTFKGAKNIPVYTDADSGDLAPPAKPTVRRSIEVNGNLLSPTIAKAV
jgi:hypothetical protein